MTHGKTICKNCSKLISQCRCIEHSQINYTTCQECLADAMTEPSGELKNCPFCGGEAMHQRTYNNTWTIECQKCFASTFAAHNSRLEAEEAWNTRPSEGIGEEKLAKCMNDNWDIHSGQTRQERFNILAKSIKKAFENGELS